MHSFTHPHYPLEAYERYPYIGYRYDTENQYICIYEYGNADAVRFEGADAEELSSKELEEYDEDGEFEAVYELHNPEHRIRLYAIVDRHDEHIATFTTRTIRESASAFLDSIRNWF